MRREIKLVETRGRTDGKAHRNRHHKEDPADDDERLGAAPKNFHDRYRYIHELLRRFLQS